MQSRLIWLVWALATLPLLSAVSSSEALAALGNCLQQNNPQLQPFGQLFQMQDTPYYVFLYPASNPQRMVAAVSQDDGKVVRDNESLSRISRGLYHDSILHDFIKTKGFDADVMSAAVTSSQSSLDDKYAKLQVFQTKTNDQYPKISFQSLQNSMDALRSKADVLSQQLSDTTTNEQQYLNAPSAEAAGSLIQEYNSSFSALFDFLNAYDDYNKAITDVERQLYQQSIPDPDNKNINTNLENLRDIGISNLYAKAKASDPRKSLATYLAQSDQWVQDSASSFEFQDLSCRADAAYKAALPQFTQISQSASAIRSVGLSTALNNVQSDWSQIQDAYDKKSAESYQSVLNNVPKVQQEMEQLKNQYQTITVPTTAPKAPQIQADISSWIILALIILLGGYGFWMYRKKQQQEAEGSLDSENDHH